MVAWKLTCARFPIVVACALMGCAGASDGASAGTTSFDGTYQGAYTGSDSGTVQMQITDGNVSVTATSSFWKTTYSGTGQVTASGQLVGTGAGGGGTATSGPIVVTYAGVSVSFAGTIAAGGATGSWSSSNSAGGTWQAHD
jgi:hypothetical protein